MKSHCLGSKSNALAVLSGVLAASTINIVFQNSAQTAELAAGVMLYQQVDSTTFRYNIDLKNTGTTTVGTLWYAWIPGQDYLGSSPSNVVSPPGWSATVTHTSANDGFGIQWVGNAGLLQPNGTQLGFRFDIQNTPAEMSGNSTAFPAAKIGTSFIYAGAPLSDAGAQISIIPTTLPWHNPFSPTDVNNSGRVNPSDVAVIVSLLLRTGVHPLGVPTTADNVPPFVDVNGSNSLDLGDALLTINDLLTHGIHAASAQASSEVDSFVVPEPSAQALFSCAIVGLIGFAAWGWRRKH